MGSITTRVVGRRHHTHQRGEAGPMPVLTRSRRPPWWQAGMPRSRERLHHRRGPRDGARTRQVSAGHGRSLEPLREAHPCHPPLPPVCALRSRWARRLEFSECCGVSPGWVHPDLLARLTGISLKSCRVAGGCTRAQPPDRPGPRWWRTCGPLPLPRAQPSCSRHVGPTPRTSPRFRRRRSPPGRAPQHLAAKWPPLRWSSPG